MIAFAIFAAALQTTPIPSLALDTSAALALAYPPCGTPEAKAAAVCLRWTVRDCAVTADAAPTGGLTLDSALPIGCDARSGSNSAMPVRGNVVVDPCPQSGTPRAIWDRTGNLHVLCMAPKRAAKGAAK